MSSIEPGSPSINSLAQTQERFPNHHYSVLCIEDIFDVDESLVRMHPNAEESPDGSLPEASPARAEKLQAYMSSLPSATARADALQTMKDRIILHGAKTNDCEAIFWGDSSTKLAEKILAETAKGRGSSIPMRISEGVQQLGVASYYPLRDVLRKEIVTFVDMVQPPLALLMARQRPLERFSAPTKTTTLDDLMSRYFKPVEDTYPNIVANVVNTASKLKMRKDDIDFLGWSPT
ncbi:MAG: cytoplasmic tRNA 2-thiolation protein 2 [Phylliscum demangeonii]|nr:MAG: cytoplasmic tRNA 2-thiolation protein 2 [Phylliscum demangeonii]